MRDSNMKRKLDVKAGGASPLSRQANPVVILCGMMCSILICISVNNTYLSFANYLQ